LSTSEGLFICAKDLFVEAIAPQAFILRGRGPDEVSNRF